MNYKKRENKKGVAAWIWILIILILLAVGVGIYFWITKGSGGSIMGSSIPQPPALPTN
ncbi:MAG: hypothetical protein PHF67_01940 [Candidatus Nanoarchaeia archaeon]|nr:hypothetical protein [Candidatus Nanoarchaeia archaeon]